MELPEDQKTMIELQKSGSGSITAENQTKICKQKE